MARKATSHPHRDPSGSAAPIGRRQRRSAEIRERLFRAALNLFAQKGFAETTVEDITEAADVGKGTFLNYFPSKDHILVALWRRDLARTDRDSVQPALDRLGTSRQCDACIASPAIHQWRLVS